MIEAWRVGKFNIMRPRPIMFKCFDWEPKIAYFRDRKKLAGVEIGLAKDMISTENGRKNIRTLEDRENSQYHTWRNCST